jgi:hypothetical protein
VLVSIWSTLLCTSAFGDLESVGVTLCDAVQCSCTTAVEERDGKVEHYKDNLGSVYIYPYVPFRQPLHNTPVHTPSCDPVLISVF